MNATLPRIFVLLVGIVSTNLWAADGRIDYDLDDDGLIEINDLADLNAIRNDAAGTSLYGMSDGCPTGGCSGYELTTDLDFDTNGDGTLNADDAYWNDGLGWNPIMNFAATFEGNGHVIRNLYISRSDYSDNLGLFGSTKGATLRNLGLTGEQMSVSGYSYVGSLVAEATDTAISGCYATGPVKARDAYVGGLVGHASSVSLTASYATGAVSGDRNYVGGLVGRASSATLTASYATGAVNARSTYAGGLVGHASSTTLTASYATGAVRASYNAGGLVGFAYYTTLTASYATGAVSGEGLLGGLVGFYNSASTVLHSHWATDTTGQSGLNGTGTGNVGVTLATLQCPTSADDTTCSTDTLYRHDVQHRHPLFGLEHLYLHQQQWRHGPVLGFRC